MLRKLLIWGKGGQGAVVEEAAMLTGQFTNIEMTEGDGLYIDDVSRWKSDEWLVHVAIGNNIQRECIYKDLEANEYSLANIIHPRAFVSPKATLGNGCYIGPLTSIQTRCVIGNGVIINTNASIDHDCVIGDFVHIAPGTNLCGSVKVGARSLLAVGSRIVPKVIIGEDCVLGAGSALVETIEGNGIKMWGVPAREVKE